MELSRSLSALIFKVNQLGDNVVFLPVVERLLAAFTFDSLTIWTTPLAAPLYQHLLPRLTLEIVTRENFYPAWKNPGKLLALMRRVRSAHADLALVAEDMGNTAYLLALLSGAGQRLGIRPSYLKIPFAINREIRLEPHAPAAEKSWTLGSALAEASGGKPWGGTPPAPDLSHLGSVPADPFDILIHAGASREYQRWPLSRYEELAIRLSSDFKVGWFAIPGSPSFAGSNVTLIPSQDLRGLVSQLARCSLFVGNNSGPMNLASALGIPSVIIVGPSARSWDPYWHADRFRVLRHESLPCIACDPPGLPIREVCSNIESPMACMNFWTVDRVESEVRDWHQKWAPHP